MPHVDELQMPRLIKAFQKITDQDVRRMIVRFAEEQLKKQPAELQSIEPRDLD